MPITVSCACQNVYRVKDKLAGKKIRCPHCKEPVSVPLQDQPAGHAARPAPPRNKPVAQASAGHSRPAQSPRTQPPRTQSPPVSSQPPPGPQFDPSASQNLQPTPYETLNTNPYAALPVMPVTEGNFRSGIRSDVAST